NLHITEGTTVLYDERFPVIPGDLDGDCQVGLPDLTLLLAHFGMASGATLSDGDLDGDGSVGLADLTILLANFGSACSCLRTATATAPEVCSARSAPQLVAFSRSLSIGEQRGRQSRNQISQAQPRSRRRG